MRQISMRLNSVNTTKFQVIRSQNQLPNFKDINNRLDEITKEIHRLSAEIEIVNQWFKLKNTYQKKRNIRAIK